MKYVLTIGVLLFQVFSFAQSANGVIAHTHYKYQTIDRVYRDIVRAITDGRSAPELELNTKAKTVAKYVPDEHKILVSTRFYDLCTQLEKDSLDAMATVLAHELAHFYKDHKFLVDFGYSELTVLEHMHAVNADSVVFIEAEADYFGGFYGYIAGYNTLDVLPQVLDLVYNNFDLNENLEGYLSLAKRKELALESKERLAALVPFFETANDMLLLGKYEIAASCFAYISSHDFQSREILLNEGVAYALAAIEKMDKSEVKFIYPIEFDIQTRLRTVRTRGLSDDNSGEVQALLERARDKLEEAKKQDPKYALTYLDLACVYSLMGEQDMAIVFATKAKKLAFSKITASDALMVKSIALYLSDDRDEAESLLSANENHPLASYTRSVMYGEEVEVPNRPVHLQANQEHVDGVYPEDIGEVELTEYKQINVGDLIFYVKTSALFDDRIVLKGNSVYRVITSKENYKGKTAHDISVGDQQKAITNTYKEPDVVRSASGYYYYHYKWANIIFMIDADSKVAGWKVYYID